MSPASERIKTRLEDLTHLVRDAEMQVQNGRMVELSTLEHDVAQICANIKSVSPQTAHDFLPMMAELISALDVLADQINNYKNRISSGG